MPLYMDIHTLDDVTVDDVAKAHMADLQIQSKYDVKYLRYWVDEDRGEIFCLVEAPSPDTAQHLIAVIDAWLGEPLTGDEALSNFITANELAWLNHTIPPEFW